jgi:hypothetical protein
MVVRTVAGDCVLVTLGWWCFWCSFGASHAKKPGAGEAGLLYSLPYTVGAKGSWQGTCHCRPLGLITSRGGESSRREIRSREAKHYILPSSDVLVAACHFMLAFAQPALLVGTCGPAKAGVKEARPRDREPKGVLSENGPSGRSLATVSISHEFRHTAGPPRAASAAYSNGLKIQLNR